MYTIYIQCISYTYSICYSCLPNSFLFCSILFHLITCVIELCAFSSFLQNFQDEAVRLYRKCALIPSITNGKISVKGKTLSIDSTWSQRNLQLNNKRTFSRRFYYSLNGDGCPEGGKCFDENFPRQTGDE